MQRTDTRPDPLTDLAFELERFEWTDDRLEVVGRWFGVRGHRFIRPTLHLKLGDRRQRLIALLDDKPWAADGEGAWTAAFAWTGEHDGVTAARLEVAPDVILDLPSPGEAAAGASLDAPHAPTPPEAANRRPRGARSRRRSPPPAAEPRQARGQAAREACAEAVRGGRDARRRAPSPPSPPAPRRPPRRRRPPAPPPPAAARRQPPPPRARFAAARRAAAPRTPPRRRHRPPPPRRLAARRGRRARRRTAAEPPRRPRPLSPPPAAIVEPPRARRCRAHAPSSVAAEIATLALERRLVEERAERERLGEELEAARREIASLSAHHRTAVERSREVVELEGQLAAANARAEAAESRAAHLERDVIAAAAQDRAAARVSGVGREHPDRPRSLRWPSCSSCSR